MGRRGRIRVRVFRTELAHKVWRRTFFEVRVLRTENSYLYSSSSSNLKIPIGVFIDRDEVEAHKNAKQERGKYPAILTEQACSIKDLLYDSGRYKKTVK